MSILGNTLAQFKEKLGRNSAWLSWIGSEAESSTGRIYIHSAPADAVGRYMEIDWSYDIRLNSAYLTGQELEATGSLLVLFADDVPDSVGAVGTADFDFLNACTAIIAELLGDPLNHDQLPLTEAELIHGPQRTDSERREADGDLIESIWSVYFEGLTVTP